MLPGMSDDETAILPKAAETPANLRTTVRTKAETGGVRRMRHVFITVDGIVALAKYLVRRGK